MSKFWIFILAFNAYLGVVVRELPSEPSFEGFMRVLGAACFAALAVNFISTRQAP